MTSYKDKELILVSDIANKASDKYNKRLTPNTFSIIKTVEDFISTNNLICYGGIAINNILPKKEQFYKVRIDEIGQNISYFCIITTILITPRVYVAHAVQPYLKYLIPTDKKIFLS